MRKLIILLILSFLLTQYNFASTESQTSNCIAASTSSYDYGEGGYKLPSLGNLHVLIVFAEFKDDGYLVNDPRWEQGEAPANMNNWVDQTWSTNPTQGSLTHYFNEMSHNKFKLTGKEIHIETEKTRAEYDALNWKRYDIHKELLEEIDITENFSNYDNWTYNDDYDHTNSADSKVDMVIFVWRNITDDITSSTDYEDELDFGNNYGDLGQDGDILVDSDTRTIETGTWGSGVTVRKYFHQDPFRIALHEFNHYLLGHNNMHNGYGYWGMLADWGTKSYTANAFEMYQLQWAEDITNCTIDITGSTTQTITKSIGDFLTTNKSLRIKYGTDQYYYVENHQKSSYWESHAPFSSHPNSIDGNIENGIYIIRQDGLLGEDRECIPADGRHDWEVVDNITNPYDSRKILPVWQNNGVDKNGNHTLERSIYHAYPGCTETSSSIYFVKNTVTSAVDEPQYYLGNGLQAFRNSYQEVFSPWSNPNNQNSSGSTLDFAVELSSISGGVATIKIYKNNPESAKPSKPQNLEITTNGSYHPVLSWDANTEPDLSSYQVWRKIDSYSWTSIATVSTNSYTDNQVIMPPAGNKHFTYKVRAKDTQNTYSVYSNEVSGVGYKIYKRSSDIEEEKIVEMPKDFNSTQNYPNPFNPSTSISFYLPKSGYVNLKVYNSLGEEVQELVNGFKSEGSYDVAFDGTDLPSGLYFYKIQAGKFTEVRKMMLLK